MKKKLLFLLMTAFILMVTSCAAAETITVYGTVVSVESITIICNVKGIVEKVNARVGDRVEKDAMQGS